jgi:ferrous iron transport protein A
MTFAELVPGAVARVVRVGGEGAFRRRLMELGILPGTEVRLVGVAPLGDPLELLVRGASLSIRRVEAERVEVTALPAARLEPARVPAHPSPPAAAAPPSSPPAPDEGERGARGEGEPHRRGAALRGRARGRA